jgi:hypothetical protein
MITTHFGIRYLSFYLCIKQFDAQPLASHGMDSRPSYSEDLGVTM